MAKLTSAGLDTLKLILRDLQTEEIKAIEKEPEIDFTLSIEYKSKIKAIISSLNNGGVNKVFGWKKIIIIITAVTLVLALAITAIALREKIADFFLEEGSSSRIKEAFLTLCGYDTFDIMRRNFKRISGAGTNKAPTLDEYIATKEALSEKTQEVNNNNCKKYRRFLTTIASL